MITTLLTVALSLLLPSAPKWLPAVVGAALPAVFEVVDELRNAEIKGPQKLQLAITEIGKQFDKAFDEIPEWSELTEVRRDTIIKGLVELALFVASLSDEKGKRAARASIRRAVRKLKRT